MTILSSIILAAALVSSTAPSTVVNKAVANEAEALELWKTLTSGFGRIKGDIVIEPVIQPHLTGTCGDILIHAYKSTTPSTEHMTKAYGDISTGKCSYMIFVLPAREYRLWGQYTGTIKGDPPGDAIDVRPTSPWPKRVRAGKTRVANFLVTFKVFG